MAIIGPRPQLVRDMVFMTDKQRQRHSVRPGLSGLAQVRGRNAISWEGKLNTDLEYGVILDMLFESLDHAIDDALHDMVKAANEQIRKRIARKKIKLLIYHLPCQSSTFTDFIIIMNL